MSPALPEAIVLKLGEFYLSQARDQRKNSNFEVALNLYTHAKEMLTQIAHEHNLKTLSRTKYALRKAQSPKTLADEKLQGRIADVYLERGDVFKDWELPDKALASYYKAQDWGHPEAQKRIDTLKDFFPQATASWWSRLGYFRHPGRSAAHSAANTSTSTEVNNLPLQFFLKNPTALEAEAQFPESDGRLFDMQQLAYCLSLLSRKSEQSTETSEKLLFNVHERAWVNNVNEEEEERLNRLAKNAVEAFCGDKLKDAPTVAEIVVLAPFVEKDLFRKLLSKFIDGIKQIGLLESDLLNGIAEIIRSAAPNRLKPAHLHDILKVLSKRLQETFEQSPDDLYSLTYVISIVLDAMADNNVKGLNRVTLHQPLLVYLKGLTDNRDPYLTYRAAYACEALKYVGNNETPFQATVRHGRVFIKGISGLVSAVRGFDVDKFLTSCGDIVGLVGGAKGILAAGANVFKQLEDLADSGLDFADCLKEGFDFTRKRAWYKALRGADEMLKQLRLTDFEQLVRRAPCSRDSAFQWGLSERLGQLAADPRLKDEIRRGALHFLEDLYKNDERWGKSAKVKRRIIQIIKELAASSPVDEAAKELYRQLETYGDEERRALYQNAPPNPYSLFTKPLPPVFPSLLDQVQNKPEVEPSLRLLKKRRLEAWRPEDKTLYVSPEVKTSLYATDNFTIESKVNEFLRSTNDKQVLLLLGDSGGGKSTFTRFLETQLWENYRKDGCIPILITLPDIDNPMHQLIDKHLRGEGFSNLQIQELKAYRQFIFILVSYDGSQQTQNLYKSNKFNQEGQWKGKVIISCRTGHLGADYRACFEPDDPQLLEEMVILPFSGEKIKEYQEAYVKANPLGWSVAQYTYVLKEIPNLQELVSNPLLLNIALKVLPHLINLEKGLLDLSNVRVTRIALYDQFVEQLFERGKHHLLDERIFSEQEKKAFEELANEGVARNGIAFIKKLAVQLYARQGSKPIISYVHFEDKGTWKEEFFGPENEKRLLRDIWPLNRSGNRHQFIHKSLLEYFVARALWEELRELTEIRQSDLSNKLTVVGNLRPLWNEQVDSVELKQLALFNQLNIVEDPAVLNFLVELVQQEHELIRLLLAWVKASKSRKDVEKAAANALTILVKAGGQFSGLDLRGIKVRGADLSYGAFDNTQFEGADLRDVNFRGAWLRGANLNKTNLGGVQLGEKRSLEIEKWISACCYSPKDGHWLAVAAGQCIHLYETEGLRKVCTYTGHDKWAMSVTFSVDGQWLASGGDDGKIKLWPISDGRSLEYTYPGHEKMVTSVAFSPNSQWIASGGGDGKVKLWNVSGDRLLEHTYDAHEENKVNSVAFSIDGQWLASGGEDGNVKLWNALGVRSLVHTYTGHEESGGVNSVAFSVNGQWLASGGGDGKVKLWNISDDLSLEHTYEDHDAGGVNSVAFSRDGQWLASGDDNGWVRQWYVSGNRSLVHKHIAHVNEEMSVTFSADSQWLTSGGGDGKVKFWNVSGDRSLTHAYAGHKFRVNSVAFSRDHSLWLASGSSDWTMKLWHVSDDRSFAQLVHTYAGHGDGVNSVVFSRDGQWLASGSYDKTVKLWPVVGNRSLAHTYTEHGSEVRSLAFSPDGQWLASGSYDKTVKLWHVLGDRSLAHTYTGYDSEVMSIAFSPDGQWLAFGSQDKKVRLWGVLGERTLEHTYAGHGGWVNSVAFSHDGQRQWLASGSCDKTVKLWRVFGDRTLVRSYEGHTDSITSVAFSVDGQWLASGSYDNTVRLWSVRKADCQAVLQNFVGPILSVAWQSFPDGAAMLATGGQDKAIRLWRVPHNVREGGQIMLEWASRQDALTAAGALIENAQNLSSQNTALLRQRGAVVSGLPRKKL